MIRAHAPGELSSLPAPWVARGKSKQEVSVGFPFLMLIFDRLPPFSQLQQGQDSFPPDRIKGCCLIVETSATKWVNSAYIDSIGGLGSHSRLKAMIWDHLVTY